MKKFFLTAAIAFAVLSTTTIAKAQSYGLAGCGLGTMVFNNDKQGKIQIIAATLNGTSGSQTFGITTGTSNCDDKQDAYATMYIESNYEVIKRDIARGAGETINSLAHVFKCEDLKKFSISLKDNYELIFNQPNKLESKNQIKALAKNNSCKIS